MTSPQNTRNKLEEMKELWFSEAAKYNGLPLADLNILER